MLVNAATAAGLVANPLGLDRLTQTGPVVLASLAVLKQARGAATHQTDPSNAPGNGLQPLHALQTGEGPPPGPYGLYGAIEGVSYLVMLFLISWSAIKNFRCQLTGTRQRC